MKYVMNRGNFERVQAQIAKLDKAKSWDVTIDPHVDRRTTDQNARLWALHTKAAEVTGYTPGQMHELALAYYFGSQRVQLGDAVIWEPKKRSSNRDKKEFADFMASVEEWYITELGVWLD